MTFGVSNEFNANDTAYLNGREVQVVSSYADYVVVVDENGNKSSVSKNALMSTPLFNFQNKELRQERKERIEHYQSLAREAGEKKNEWQGKVKEYLSQMNNAVKNSDLYKLLKGELYAAKVKRTAYSNQQSGYYLDAFLEATSTRYWG